MTRTQVRRLLQPLALAVAIVPSFGAASSPGGWTEAFEACPASFAVDPDYARTYNVPAPLTVTGTLRYTAFVTVSGTAVRVRLTNEKGTAPLVIEAASIALAGEAPESAKGAIVPLRFGGQTSITIPAGAPAISDPVPLKVAAADHLIVSIYAPHGIGLEPIGGAAMVVADGNQTTNTQLQNTHPMTGRPFVSGLAVETGRPLPVVVALGDSLTDGVRGNPRQLRGYPGQLALRFARLPVSRQRSVVNAGIGGNRILQSSWGDNALSRLERDVFRIPGVTHLIVFEGINDIGMSGRTVFGDFPLVTAAEVIAGYRQIIARAHARGIKVVLGTLPPFKASGYYSPEKDVIRQVVNDWIRSSREFNGFIDFDAILRNPADPLHIRPEFDSGDHLHPNDIGYAAMGNGINLALLR
jgi:lysophospholipase L1-like esterase